MAGIKHGLGNPRTMAGGFVRWENHLTKWEIFQHVMFDYRRVHNIDLWIYAIYIYTHIYIYVIFYI